MIWTAELVRGAWYLVRGVGMLARPGLRLFVVLPLLVNSLLLGGAVYYAYTEFLAGMASWLPSWLSWLSWILVPLFLLVTQVVVFMSFSFFANLLAAPFNTLLAERVERELTGFDPPRAGGWAKALGGFVPGVLNELGKLLYVALWAVPLILISFTPVVNLAAPVLWLLFSGWMMALEYLDYPLGNHGFSGGGMRRRLAGRRMLAFGFGLAVTGLMMVPVANFLAMPGAVVGGTLLWIEVLRGRVTAPPPGEGSAQFFRK